MKYTFIKDVYIHVYLPGCAREVMRKIADLAWLLQAQIKHQRHCLTEYRKRCLSAKLGYCIVFEYM